MRVVNGARLDATRPPTERSMTLCAVHLVTPVNFENHRGALGTVARIPCQELGRLDAVRVARVWRVLLLTLDLMALRTRPVVTHTTLPCAAQKPTAVVGRTRADKLALLIFHMSTMKPSDQLILVPLKVLHIYHKIAHQLALLLTELMALNTGIKVVVKAKLDRQWSEFAIVYSVPSSSKYLYFAFVLSNLLRNGTNLELKFHIGLGGRHEALFTLEEKGLAPILVVATDEFLCEIVHQNFTGPRLAARHAVGILCGFQ
jgi:hypothetical protein